MGANTALETAKSFLENDIRDKKHLMRHFDLIDFDKLNTPITVIGAGGIGSWTTFALAKMGFSNITVFDPDKVGIENVGNQIYSFFHIGKEKVFSLAALCKSVGTDIYCNDELFTPKHAAHFNPGIIVIMAVDSMATRKMIAENVPLDCFLIDGRMGAEKILIYTAFNKKTRASYAKTLYSDDNAHQAPCTAKATSYCALTIAGLIVGQVKSYLSGKKTLKNLSFDAATADSIRFSH